VHLIGSHCLNVDTDDYISGDDVAIAVDLIISETLKSTFETKIQLAGAGKYRDILEAAASFESGSIPLQHICDKTGWSQNAFSANMGHLCQRDILLRPQEGFYEFVDPLLREYIRKFGAKRISTPNGHQE
jgi:hypothetical protein